MASYSPIANAEIDAESPLTESLFVRMRDNPLAIQEGDPTAPKNQTESLADKAVTAAKIADATITTTQIANLTVLGGPAGDIALATITPENMSDASSKFVVDANGGYATLASGVLIQWQSVLGLGNGLDTTLTWDVPFTTSVFFVGASTSISNVGIEATNALQVITDYTLTQVTVKNQDVHGSGTVVSGVVFALGI